jgi:DNA-binding winged helix-turn-helix (wHTH) protein/tetratricopeptide (TPR) repeat protein
MDTYRFSDVELRVATREVLVAGQPVDLEPRTFDLLIYLIENRSRVVSKSELLEKVWHTAYVSESVLARAVMKLRKALGEGDTDDGYVKTMHRVGYRFVGDLGASGPSVSASQRPVTPTLALLPISNQTGDETLAWVELGLLTLIMRAVAESSRIPMVPIASMLIALQGIPAGTEVRQRPVLLHKVLGSDRIVQLAVRALESDGYALSWALWRAEEGEVEGELRGTQLTNLAMQFAKQCVALIDRQPMPVKLASLTPDEDFANAAHARAIEAFARERYPHAVALMRACADIEPHPLRMDIDLAAMLVPTHPAEASTRCKRLLAGHLDEMSVPDTIALYRALANLTLHDKHWDLCEEYCARAAALLAERGEVAEDDWVAASRFKMALARGENNFARHTAQDILERARSDRDQVRVAQALANLGWLELDVGDPGIGTSLLNEAVELARVHKLTATQSLCVHELGRHMRALGRPERAIELLKEAGELNQSAGYVIDSGQIFANLYRAHADRGDRDQALGCIAEVDRIIKEIGRSTVALRSIHTDARMRFENDGQATSDALAELSVLVPANEPHWALGMCLIVLVATGAKDQAAQWLQTVEPLVGVERKALAHTTYLAGLAQIRYAQDDLAAARDALERYVRLRGGVLGATLVCTDLMWLILEQGDTSKAAQLAPGMRDHLEQTLRGQVTLARLHYQLGEIERARALQDDVVERSRGHRALGYLETLRAFYGQTPARQRHGFPKAPALPSAF